MPYEATENHKGNISYNVVMRRVMAHDYSELQETYR